MQHATQTRAQRGFTLIEIAIVLVIIGLLLGGVLKGQEMITQGKIRSAEKEIDGLAMAVHTYRDRYRALPGDDAQASGRWTGSGNGNADNQIGGAFNSSTSTDESRLLWQQLRHAGLLAGDKSSTVQASNTVGGQLGIQANITNGTNILLSGPVVCSTNLPANIANAIDAQQDDGTPGSGSLRAFQQTASNTPDFSSLPTAYTDNDTIQYTLCKRI
jgi:prepilin-type N-terminal cleavage/methylation domain-containing protein